MSIQLRFLIVAAVGFVAAALIVLRIGKPKPIDGQPLESAAPTAELNGFDAE